jgi:hypothetical protein
MRAMPSVAIRNAVSADAQAACEVMRRSVAELCDADHHNDPKILTAWLGNKQPRIFHAWLAEPDNSVLVAVDGDRIVSVGAVRDSGEITRPAPLAAISEARQAFPWPSR